MIYVQIYIGVYFYRISQFYTDYLPLMIYTN